MGLPATVPARTGHLAVGTWQQRPHHGAVLLGSANASCGGCSQGAWWSWSHFGLLLPLLAAATDGAGRLSVSTAVAQLPSLSHVELPEGCATSSHHVAHAPVLVPLT